MEIAMQHAIGRIRFEIVGEEAQRVGMDIEGVGIARKVLCQSMLCGHRLSFFVVIPPIVAQKDVLVVLVGRIGKNDIFESLRETRFLIIGDAVSHKFSAFVEKLWALRKARLPAVGVVEPVRGVDVASSAEEVGLSCGVRPLGASVVVQIFCVERVFLLIDQQHVFIKIGFACGGKIVSLLRGEHRFSINDFPSHVIKSTTCDTVVVEMVGEERHLVVAHRDVVKDLCKL